MLSWQVVNDLTNGKLGVEAGRRKSCPYRLPFASMHAAHQEAKCQCQVVAVNNTQFFQVLMGRPQVGFAAP